jgi:GWxTD domain-containing protein
MASKRFPTVGECIVPLLDARRLPPLTFACTPEKAQRYLHDDRRLSMRRLALVLSIAGALAACGGGGAGKGSSASGPAPAPDDMPAVTSTSGIYRGVGRLAAADPLPFVGNVAFAQGVGDTTLAILGLSLENRSLNFQREPSGFSAHYRVDITLRPVTGAPVQVGREETVRVATQPETGRTDESVLFQQHFKLLPGPYNVIVNVRDMNAGVESRAEGDYTVPKLAPGTSSEPILAYQVQGRATPADPLKLVINPRGVVSFGGDTLLAYIEGYAFPRRQTVPFEVRDGQDSLVYRDSLRFQGGRPIESQVIRIAPDSLVLGEMRLVVGSGATARRSTAIVSFTSQWLVTSYDQMLSLLRYFGPNPALDSLRRAAPADRAHLWREFRKSSDPDPKTPQNEQLDEYFSRLATANAQIKDEGMPGWRTDRGEVFVVLGAPDEVTEQAPSTSSRVIRWVYYRYRLTLFFVDESSFGRFRLTSRSRADYEHAVSRLRHGGGETADRE